MQSQQPAALLFQCKTIIEINHHISTSIEMNLFNYYSILTRDIVSIMFKKTNKRSRNGELLKLKEKSKTWTTNKIQAPDYRPSQILAQNEYFPHLAFFE